MYLMALERVLLSDCLTIVRSKRRGNSTCNCPAVRDVVLLVARSAVAHVIKECVVIG
jgi:hypothetical protein